MANEPTQTMEEELSQPSPKKSKFKSKRFLLLFVVPLILIAGSIVLYLHGGRYVETENAYVKADKTPINAEVAGRVIHVPVEENQHVKKGDLLVQIDPTPYEYAVDRAKANLADVRTELETLKAEYQSKLANIDVAQSQLDYARLEEKRQYNLRQKNYSSEAEYDSARQKTLLFELQINALQKALKQVAESLGGDPEAPTELHPKYQLALAELDQAKNDLEHVNVYAPNDGVVSKVLEDGQYITSNSTTMLLVADKNLWIEANFTEKEMTNIKVGQEVDIEIDYAPGHQWKGHVTSISPATGSEYSVIPAQNATGNWVKVTQRLPIRISIEEKENMPTLRAGLSAIVTVDTKHTRHLSF
ncbi:MAG TPA: hemolysin D [Vibrio sp.]|uniref:HlyD family secretion protein n=1 Tax=Vibrio sp. TaxID=678 RepID=UPI000EE227BF|nr:HlyD family secretion protein [Vibrio sp.]HCH01982.1 hemolysin D [Vibrio sp.]